MKRILRANNFDVVIQMFSREVLWGGSSAVLRSARILRKGGNLLLTPDLESVHQILMLRVVFLGAQPDPNTITSNKQQFCFNHKSNVYMINAIYSNLISLLWAQAESIVPALWLCTWLCWFFLLPLFICLHHGLQDLQHGSHGPDLQTGAVWKCCQLGDEFRASLKAFPNLPVALHKRYKTCCWFIIVSVSPFQRGIL